MYFRESETIPNQTTEVNFYKNKKVGKNYHYYTNMAAIYTDYLV